MNLVQGLLVDWLLAAQIGQFLAGLSLAGGTITAIALFKWVQKRQVEDAWSKEFRDIYEAFWLDPDCTEVRKWILNEGIYDAECRSAFTERNKFGKRDCRVAREQHDRLERMDRFCAFMMRALSFPRDHMSLHDQAIWEGFLDPKFWMDRVKDREEMMQYVAIHWPTLDPTRLGTHSIRKT